MADMFGGFEGVRQAEADTQAAQIHSLSIQEEGIKIQEAGMALTAQRKMLDFMNQHPFGQGGTGGVNQANPATTAGVTDMSSAMDYLSQAAMNSGQFEKSKEYATAASTLRKNASDIEKNNLNNVIKNTTILSSLYEDVHDETSKRQADAMFQIETGKPSPWAKVPFNEGIVAKLKEGVQTAKSRAEEQAAKARTLDSLAEAQERRARLPLIRTQIDLNEARTDALIKAGAVQKIPKASDLRAVTDLVTSEYNLLPEEARVVARPIAERMLDLMKTNGITQNQAAHQAFREAKANGDLGGYKTNRQSPGSYHNPLPYPKLEEDTREARQKLVRQLQPNMYYQGVGKYAGKSFLWTGSNFVEEGNAPGDVSEEDDEDVVDKALKDDDEMDAEEKSQ